MATLKQCDRCKFVGPIPTVDHSVETEDSSRWELCETCFKLIEMILCDGGAQWRKLTAADSRK